MKNKIITIFGGSGFVGRYIVREIAKLNYNINIVCRDIEAAKDLKLCGSIGQITLTMGNVCEEQKLEKIISNSDVVINLVGILFEKNKNDFCDVHIKAAANIARVSHKLKIKQLIHFSALGVDDNQSKYAKTKKMGEIEVLKHFPQATIIRPSVIFGREDNFINKFKEMSVFSPFMPLIHKGKTKFQPVYVGDIAKLVSILVEKQNFQGKIIAATGEEIYSLKQILEFILQVSKRKRYFININKYIAIFLGKIFNKIMSNPVITADQVLSLEYDNIITNNDNINLSNFNIKAIPFEKIKDYQSQ